VWYCDHPGQPISRQGVGGPAFTPDRVLGSMTSNRTHPIQEEAGLKKGQYNPQRELGAAHLNCALGGQDGRANHGQNDGAKK